MNYKINYKVFLSSSETRLSLTESHCFLSFCQFFVNFNNEQFYIKLPDGNMVNFPNRLGDVKYKYFDVRGDAKIISIKVK